MSCKLIRIGSGNKIDMQILLNVEIGVFPVLYFNSNSNRALMFVHCAYRMWSHMKISDVTLAHTFCA